MPNRIVAAQVSDTRDDDSSNAAGNKKNNHAYNDAWLIIF